MAEKTFAAFFSYVHDDDTHDNGRVTKLRQMLEEEVRALSGEEFEIFQDYEDIHWGQKWEQRLNHALDGSTFLISVVTPRYIRKEFCRKEMLRFLERENRLGRNDLVLSIYYIDTDLRINEDPVTSAISSHQYFDWRDLRHEPQTNPEVGKRIEKMAREIIAAMRRNTPYRREIVSAHDKKLNDNSPVTQVDDLTTSTEANQPTKRVDPLTIVVDTMPHRGDYMTITRAIKSAEPGTRILIRPGLYKEALIIDKPLELIGDGKREEIVIEARGRAIIRFKTEFGRITNLTLRQAGGGNFYGVDISQGRPELEDCDITSQSLACVVIHDGADPRLRRNRIHNGQQSGIYVYDDGRGTLEDNDIFGNAYSGVAIKTGGDPTFRRNRIHGGKQNGVYVYKSGKGTLEDNDIFANTYAGVYVRENGNPVLRRNRINKNGFEAIWIELEGGGLFEENDLRNNPRGAWDIDKLSESKIRRSRNIER